MAGERKPDHAEHRRRLRQRFLDGGSGALPDYELVELLLTMAIPRGDVKPAAKALMARFRTFDGVVNASVDDLRTVRGLGEVAPVAIKIVRAAADRLLQAELQDRDILSSFDAVLAYCKAAMAFEQREAFRVLFLDRKNRLIADEELQKGTVDHAPVYPREIARRALELGATALILVHNHPSGDPTPSRADITMTAGIVAALKAVDIVVHDHIVIARGGHSSLRTLGHL
ncbi:MAG: DNA repair protein RadC [Rhodospirillales bacterium]|nr:DNA repair protein RadC [Rhodospirillales bacterium]